MCCFYIIYGVKVVVEKSFYRKLSHENRYIILCCFFIFFVNGIYSMIFGSILPYISDANNLNDTVSGMLISSHQAGNLIAGLIAGLLPYYLGRKNSIIFLSSFVIVGFLLIVFTGQPWLLMAAFFFTGISRGSISNFNNKMVNDVSDSSPSALNFLHSLFAVGALLSPFMVLIAMTFLPENGWKVVCLIIVGLILISQLLFSKMTLDDNRPVKRKKTSGGNYNFFKSRSFWVTVVILFFYLCAESAITGWIVKYFVDANIMTVGRAQVIASLLWFAILIGRLGCTFYGHLLQKRHLLLLISTSASIFYILLMASQNFLMIAISVFFLGVSMGGIYPTAMTIAGDSIKEYPMAMGWLLVIGGIGGITMPIVTGVLSTNYGVFAGMSAIILAIVLMLVGVIIYNLLSRKNELT